MSEARPGQSEYMHWAKTHPRTHFDLATSGIPPIALADLGAVWDDLALEPPRGYGYAPLSEAISARYGVSAEHVVTAAGTSGANHLAMAALLDRGDDVVCETPGYEPLGTLAAHLGAHVRTVERRAERGFAIDPDDLARALSPRTRLVVLSNLHNPSSAAIDEPTLRALGDLAGRVGATVLVDEVYLDAAFERAPRSAAGLDGPFVVTSSLTKVYGISGLRAGWIVASPELARRMWRLKDLFGVNDAHPAERLALSALARLEDLAARARRILDANRSVWNEFVARHADYLAVEPQPWGTTSFPRLRRTDGDTLAAVLSERYETTIVPGRYFGAPRHVRVGLCCDPETFPEALERLQRALLENG